MRQALTLSFRMGVMCWGKTAKQMQVNKVKEVESETHWLNKQTNAPPKVLAFFFYQVPALKPASQDIFFFLHIVLSFPFNWLHLQWSEASMIMNFAWETTLLGPRVRQPPPWPAWVLTTCLHHFNIGDQSFLCRKQRNALPLSPFFFLSSRSRMRRWNIPFRNLKFVSEKPPRSLIQ